MKMLDLADHLSIPSDKLSLSFVVCRYHKVLTWSISDRPKASHWQNQTIERCFMWSFSVRKTKSRRARVGQYFYGLLTDQNPNSSALCSLLTSYFIYLFIFCSLLPLFFSLYFVCFFFLPSFVSDKNIHCVRWEGTTGWSFLNTERFYASSANLSAWIPLVTSFSVKSNTVLRLFISTYIIINPKLRIAIY